MSRVGWIAGCLAFAALACQHDYPVPGPWNVLSEGTGTSGGTTSGESASSFVPVTSSSSTTSYETFGEDEVDSIHFLVPHDVPMHECDIFDQDCRPGHKCTYYYVESDAFWQARCVPVPPNPHQAGEPCAWTLRPEDGIDDCDAGLYCFGLGGLSFGTCVGYCLDGRGCAPCQLCSFNNSFIPVCIPQCDPNHDTCPVGSSCVYGIYSGFICAVDDEGRGSLGMECDDPYDCPAGTECDGPVPGCPGDACCTAVCAPSDPSACMAQPGTVCEPFSFSGHDCSYLDDVGTCVLPPTVALTE